MADIIQIRRDDASVWTSVDPILAQGELGVELDTRKVKVGDGVNHWTDIDYLIDVGGYVTESQAVVNFTGDLQNNGFSVLTEDANGDLDMNGNKVLFANVYPTVGDLPSATTYHGMFAHVHGTGEAYFAHAGNWVQLAQADSSGGTIITGELSAVDGDFSGTVKATAYEETFSAVTSSTGSAIVDCTLANNFEHVLTENTTFVFAIPSGDPTDAFGFTLGVKQDASASGYTVTWPASVVWPEATAPTLSPTASADDQFVFYTNDNGSSWYGFVGGYSFG